MNPCSKKSNDDCDNLNDLSELEAILGYSFKNSALLKEALTHSSYAHENGIGYDYEQLEFLGDAVLDFLISEFIVTKYRNFNEGDMSRLRAYLVNEKFLSTIVRMYGICMYILLGKGERQSGVCSKDSILADIFESICAAVYLDGGYDEVRKVFLKFFADSVNSAATNHLFFDEKSKLQEITQKRFGGLPQYRVVSENGLDHAKEYVVEVSVADTFKALGGGRSKRAAEKDAAKNVLAVIKLEENV